MKRMVREEAKVQPVRWMGLTGFICFYFVDKENNQCVFIYFHGANHTDKPVGYPSRYPPGPNHTDYPGPNHTDYPYRLPWS